MTTEDTFQSLKASSYDAISFDSLIRVSTARRIKATKTLPKHFAHKPVLQGEGFLVQPYRTECNVFEHSFLQKGEV